MHISSNKSITPGEICTSLYELDAATVVVLVEVNSTRSEMMSEAKIVTANPRICQFLTSSESNICNYSVIDSNVTLFDDESL